MSTGSLTPRRWRDPTGRSSTPDTPDTSPAVTADARIWPPRATDMMRAARFTAVPKNPFSRSSASPECKPIRTEIDSPSGHASASNAACAATDSADGVTGAGERRRQPITPRREHVPVVRLDRRVQQRRHGEQSPRPSPPARAPTTPSSPPRR